uniref:Uncharacterized protein n=1 Tax=Caenorhabditis tropicalis TaxID=1561998 RepID=A0A1I7U0R3_9PELO
MLSPPQKACIELIVNNMPEPIKDTPIVFDVADDSMKHIMGGDPLESLRCKCVRQVLANMAVMNDEKLINFLKTNNLDNFFNCFLNKSPDLMMSILNYCPVLPADSTATITMYENWLHFQINNNTFIKIESKSYEIPQWLPFLCRRLCLNGYNRINIQIEGHPNPKPCAELRHYREQVIDSIRKTDYSKADNDIHTTTEWKYALTRGALCIPSGPNRKGQSLVFAQLNRIKNNTKRDINELMNTDFSKDNFESLYNSPTDDN